MMFLSKTFYLSDDIKCRDPHICTVPGDYLEEHKCHAAFVVTLIKLIYICLITLLPPSPSYALLLRNLFSISISEIH